MMTQVKSPILSIILDQTISLDFTKVWGSSQKTFLRMKVRVEGILKGIWESIQKQTIPDPLIRFLKEI